jgi:hypothetical protein
MTPMCFLVQLEPELLLESEIVTILRWHGESPENARCCPLSWTVVPEPIPRCASVVASVLRRDIGMMLKAKSKCEASRSKGKPEVNFPVADYAEGDRDKPVYQDLRSFLDRCCCHTALSNGMPERHRTNTALRWARPAAAAALGSVDYPVCQGPGTT